MNVLGVVAIVIAVTSLIMSAAALIVTYQTMKDLWDKVTDMDRRMHRLERKNLDREDV